MKQFLLNYQLPFLSLAELPTAVRESRSSSSGAGPGQSHSVMFRPCFGFRGLVWFVVRDSVWVHFGFRGSVRVWGSSLSSLWETIPSCSAHVSGLRPPY